MAKLPTDVNALHDQYGLAIDQTGGGCLALAYSDSVGYHLWFTVNGSDLPTDTDEVCEWGVYDPKGDANWIAQGTDTFMNIYVQRDALLRLGRHVYSSGIQELTFESVGQFLDAYTLDKPATWFELAEKAEPGMRVRFTAAHDIYPEAIVPAGTEGVIKETGLNEIWGGLLVLPDDEVLRAKLAMWDGCIQLGYDVGLDPATEEPRSDGAWQSPSPICMVQP